MKLTEEQIEFLDRVCMGRVYWNLNSNNKIDVIGSVNISSGNLTEIPIKFGRVEGGYFDCSNNNLTTLKNCPDYVSADVYCHGNPLTDYFKSIKEEDFTLWGNLQWGQIVSEYPFLVNIMKNRLPKWNVEVFITKYPLTKIYLE